MWLGWVSEGRRVRDEVKEVPGGTAWVAQSVEWQADS